MKKYALLQLFSFCIILLNSCCHINPYPKCPGQNEYAVAATLYNQQSGEYRALALQAYTLAKLRLDDTLKDTAIRNLPLAVITDLDETALDNSNFQGQLIKDNKTYTELWDSYVKLSMAKAVPGAVEFFNYVNNCNAKYSLKNKIRIFYITNRDSSQFNATAINLARLGLPQIDSVNFKNDSNLLVERDTIDKHHVSNKEYRFKLVKSKDTVLLQLGDNLNDFSGAFYHLPDSARKSKVDSFYKTGKMGKYYIAFPNAMYGDWVSPGLPVKDSANAAISRRLDVRGYK